MIDVKPVHIAPLTGLLDDRSQPDLMLPESFRNILNFRVYEQNKLERRNGWSRYLTSAAYNNEDLHDQMLALQTYYDCLDSTDPELITDWPNAHCANEKHIRTTDRQPVTLLFPTISVMGNRKLIAATESRIYAGNEKGGNWRLLGDGFGTDSTDVPVYRFRAAQSQDVIIFTNNYNKVMFWTLDGVTTGCDMSAVRPIPDLDLIGLTKAAHVWMWKDVVFLADVEMDGIRYRHRLVWGDYQGPLSFDPSKPDSIAGYQDLEYGERIMGGMPMGELFIVYTNRRIWQIQAVGGEETFSATKRYNPNPEAIEACLAYPNTLCSIGDSHCYSGRDGIYEFDLYSPAPKRVDWIHRGTNQIFSDINVSRCDDHIARYNTNTKEIWFSWAQAGEDLPSKSLVINTAWKHVSTVNYGFSAMAMYQPNWLDTIRDFVLNNDVGTLAELTAAGYGFIKEGLPTEEEDSTGTPITCIYSTTDITEDGALVEDYHQVQPSIGSLCEKFLTNLIDDFCDKCETSAKMVLASSEDWCLKQIDEVYYRQTCSNPTGTGTEDADGYTSAVGTYTQDGYQSLLEGKAETFGQPYLKKQLDMVEIEAIPVSQSPPSALNFSDGGSAQVVDTNGSSGAIMWTDEDAQDFEYKDGTAAENAASYTSPSSTFAWTTYMVGRYIYWKMSISGIGGAGSFSRVSLFPRLKAEQ